MSEKSLKFYIQTFGCIQNTSDSEKVKNFYLIAGHEETKNWKEADVVIINTCVIRQTAENRAYGFLRNAQELKKKIVITGCLVGVMKKNVIKNMETRKNFPGIEFISIDDFKTKWEPIKKFNNIVLIPISYGCNNMCSYCIVPQARGREISRKMEDVLVDVDNAIKMGNKNILLIGQNVNSYGAELQIPPSPFLTRGEQKDFGIVKMGKKRFRSLFPYLLEEVAKKDLEKLSFVSNNPWDFSDDLIDVIAKYKNIDKLIHLPFQAGNNEILKKMNRNYTKQEYLELVEKIKTKISNVKISTDVIIGFPGETDEKFEETIDICNKVKFEVAYLNKYSPRPGTISAKLYKDDVPMAIKKERWVRLEEMINKKA